MPLTINGEAAEFSAGESLVDVLQRVGFQLEWECNHPEFRPVESTEACAIEVNGKLARACSTPAADGMRVTVAWPRGKQRSSNGFDEAAARKVILAEMGREGPLLPILHGLQAEFGYVPREAEPVIASMLNITRAEVHGVVSFYHDFRRKRAGRHVLRLCRAEACQSMGGERNAERLLKHLGLEWGGTTVDGELTVEPVYCLGLCATAPGAMLDGAPLGRVTPETLEGLVVELTAEPRR